MHWALAAEAAGVFLSAENSRLLTGPSEQGSLTHDVPLRLTPQL